MHCFLLMISRAAQLSALHWVFYARLARSAGCLQRAARLAGSSRCQLPQLSTVLTLHVWLHDIIDAMRGARISTGTGTGL
jgi:hypothetical protein